MSGLGNANIIGNHYIDIKFNFGQFSLIVIFFSTIFFNGGVPYLLDLKILNNYSDLYYLLFYLISPLISSYILYNYFKFDFFSLRISFHSLFLIFFISIFLFGYYLNNINLYGDEVYYTGMCFNIVDKIVTFLEIEHYFPFILSFPYGLIVRLFLIVQWLVLGAILIFLLKSLENKNGVYYFLLFLFIAKFSLIYFKVGSGIHPPLNYFFPSLIMGVFGVNSITVKLSILLTNLLFYLYCITRLKLSKLTNTFLLLSIVSIPLIGFSSFHFEQAIFSFFCFVILMIEISFNKPNPSRLFLLISFFILFRYSNIAALLPGILYSFFYYFKGSPKQFAFKAFLSSMIPMILFIPILFPMLIQGTPSTVPAAEIFNYKFLVNQLSSFRLLENSINLLEFYIIIPALFLLYLIIAKRFSIILYMIILFFAYILLFQLSNGSIYASKYYLELWGFTIVIPIVYWFRFLDNDINWRHSFLISIYTVTFLSFYCYSIIFFENKFLKDRNQSYFFNVSENFSPIKSLNNNYQYIFDFIKSNGISSESLVLGIDYGATPFILNGGLYKDYLAYKINSKLYRMKNNNNNKEWLDIDIDIVNSMEDINYVFISDYVAQKYSNEISKLENELNWRKIGYIPKSYNYSSVIMLKRAFSE